MAAAETGTNNGRVKTRFANDRKTFIFHRLFMAETWRKLIEKKRFRSSSSEESSSPPRLTQENKKSRNENSSSTNHEGEENPLSVFEMSETLDGKLQAILTKLEKLDAIEKSETFKTARRNNIPAAFSKSQPDKLYIRGRLWPIGKPFDLSLLNHSNTIVSP